MSILKEVVADGYVNMNKQNAEQQRVVQEQNLANQIQAREAKRDLAETNKQLKAENDFYKALLARPMAEIASVNEDFKETYYKQQELLGEWIVSQRAFKEIAIQLGLELGKTKEEVINEATATESKVLNNETKHGNNFDQNDWQIFYAPRIKSNLKIK